METQTWCPHASSVVGWESQKRNNCLCLHFCLTESCPSSSYPDARQFSSLPCVPGAFELLSQHWSSEGVSLSKFVWALFKRNYMGLQRPSSHPATLPAGYYSQNLWGFFFLSLQPWTGGPVVGLGPITPQGVHLDPRYTSWYLCDPCRCGISPFCVSSPPTSLNLMTSLNS